MNWYKIFYWFTVADNVKFITGALTIVFGILFAIAICCVLLGEERYRDWDNLSKKTVITITLIFIFNLFIWALLPSKKDALIIITGGAVGEFVTKDSSARQIPSDLTKYLHTFMQSEIKDLDDNTKKELGLQTEKEKYIDKLKDLTKEEIINHLKQDSLITK